MNLKQKLEAVWARKRVACPSHRTIWSTEPVGWKYTVHLFWAPFHLYYRHGRLVGRKYFWKSPFYNHKKKVEQTMFNRR